MTGHNLAICFSQNIKTPNSPRWCREKTPVHHRRFNLCCFRFRARTRPRSVPKGSGCDRLIRFVFTVKRYVFLIDDCFYSPHSFSPTYISASTWREDAMQSGLETWFVIDLRKILDNFFYLYLNPVRIMLSLSLSLSLLTHINTHAWFKACK